jgi:redox-sensitive bicupin YhaK (pirin superfamily)
VHHGAPGASVAGWEVDVSNLELRPRETECGGDRPDVEWELLAARDVPLGGPRAMTVRRTLPHRDRRTIGAWCFVDDYGPDDIAGTTGMQVPPHPHTGLQTVSWLLEGEILHRDSLGCEQRVRPGELNLMTAGRGISHSEESPPDRPPRLRGVQLWVALPDAQRDAAPAFDHHADLPRVQDGDLDITVVTGDLAGTVSPARTFTPLLGVDLVVAAGGSGVVPLNPDHEHAVLALGDGLLVADRPVPASTLAYLGVGRRDLALASSGPSTRALVLGGPPLDEQLLMWWNFVGRTHDEIAAAREEWERSRGGDDTRFGHVRGYAGPPLAAPELPTVRLRPRPRHRS